MYPSIGTLNYDTENVYLVKISFTFDKEVTLDTFVLRCHKVNDGPLGI